MVCQNDLSVLNSVEIQQVALICLSRNVTKSELPDSIDIYTYYFLSICFGWGFLSLILLLKPFANEGMVEYSWILVHEHAYFIFISEFLGLIIAAHLFRVMKL